MTSAMYGEPLLNSGSARAARDFVDALHKTLRGAASDAAELNAVVQQRPSAETAHAIEASRHMLEAAAELRVTADPVLTYSRTVPDINVTVRTAHEILEACDALLDVLEDRLNQKYGVKPVILPASEEEERARQDEESRQDGSADPNPKVACRTPSKSPKAFNFTAPVIFPEPEIPSTPSLNDFGIDSSTLEGLKDPSLYQHFSAQKYRRTPKKLHRLAEYDDARQRDGEVESTPNEPTTDEFVRDSMRPLHIQTPVQVADKYRDLSNSLVLREIETPQQIAARFPPVQPTPNTLQKLTSHRRALTYDTPEPASVVRQTRSRSKRMALRAIVDDKYSSLPNFVQSKLTPQMIIAACEQLQMAHEKAGPCNALSLISRDLSKLVANATGNKVDLNSLAILALNKLEIVRVEKKPGQELQYIFDPS